MAVIISLVRVFCKLPFSTCHIWVSVQRTKKRQFHLGLPLILKAKLAHNFARAVGVLDKGHGIMGVHFVAAVAEDGVVHGQYILTPCPRLQATCFLVSP